MTHNVMLNVCKGINSILKWISTYSDCEYHCKTHQRTYQMKVLKLKLSFLAVIRPRNKCLALCSM